MAAGAKAFGISLGVDLAIGFICLLFFCFMRLRRLMRKFYMPRQFMDSTETAQRPKALSKRFYGWIRPAWATSEDDIIRVAGYDAAMYIKIMSFAFEIFTWVALLMIVFILPVNLVGQEVSRLTGTDNVPTSPYTYWVPPSGAPTTSDTEIKAPNFYAKTPPAPPGVQWWKYNSGVPPLPDPSTVLGSNYTGYAWRYDASYSAKSYTFSDLDKVTITNVQESSHLLWAHAVATWFVALIVMRATWRYSRDAVQLHIMYLRNAARGSEAHSVVVTDIPGLYAGTVSGFVPEKLRRGVSKGVEKSRIPEALGSGTNFVLPSSVPRRRSSSISINTPRTPADGENGSEENTITVNRGGAVADLDAWVAAQQNLSTGMTIEDMVSQEYNELYSGDVEAVHVVYQSKDLDPLVEEYQSILRNLEDMIDDYASKLSREKSTKRQTTRVIGAKYDKWGKQNYGGWWPTKTDTLDWYVKRATELRKLILEEQDKCSRKPGPTAFVTFKSRRSQTIAANSLQHPDVKSWHVASAPRASDIIWENIRLRSWEQSTRFTVVWVLFVVMSLFYTIPVGAVQAIIEVQRLENVPVFKQLVQIAFIRSLIEAILPGLVLNIFLALLPALLNFMNRQQGMISKSQVDFGTNRKFYIFLIITVFFGSIIGGTLFNQFNQWIDSPSSAVTILGTSTPLTSIFFLTYITLQAFVSLPVNFLRLLGLVIYWIKSKFAATPRAKARVWQQQNYSYGQYLPRHMLILFVAVVFSVINPLVPLIAIAYFAVALLLERYNMLYIYVPQADSGGKLWTEAYAQIITALFFLEILMIALLAIKKSFSAILVVPLLAVTFIFWQACKPIFQKPLSVLALRTAVDMDQEDRDREGEISLDEPARRTATSSHKTSYMMPVMDFDEEKFDNVLREAQDVNLALEGKKELDMQTIGEDVETGKSSGTSDSDGSPQKNTANQRLLFPDNEGGDSASAQHTAQSSRAGASS